MADRAIELLAFPDDGQPRMILDLGCGSGLSGNSIAAAGHYWVGMDISKSMLDVAQKRLIEYEDDEESEMDIDGTDEEEEFSSDDEDFSSDDESSDDEASSSSSSTFPSPDQCIGLLHHDMGDGVCFRPGTFDGCISISALQWLCHSNRSRENPKSRLSRLFSTLFGSLARGARAIFQFYPETGSQIDLILGCAMKAGFTGGLVIDFPNSTKAKKYYLCLMTGPGSEIPQGLQDSTKDHIQIDRRSRKRQHSNRKRSVHDKKWVMDKKELSRKRGENVKSDSKYTARRRRIKF